MLSWHCLECTKKIRKGTEHKKRCPNCLELMELISDKVKIKQKEG